MRQINLIPAVICSLFLLASCASNEPETQQSTQAAQAETAAPAPVPEAPAPSPDTATAKVESSIAPKEKPTKKSPPNARVGVIGNNQYVSGYVSRDKAVLQASPTANAAKTSDLKRYETVYIMETKMTDEAGKSYDVPQWYKVQLNNKKEGWVLANCVTMN